MKNKIFLWRVTTGIFADCWENSRRGDDATERRTGGRRPRGFATRCACERLPTYGSLAVNLTGVYLNLRSATAPEPCTARHNVWPYEYALDTVWGLPRACAGRVRARARAPRVDVFAHAHFVGAHDRRYALVVSSLCAIQWCCHRCARKKLDVRHVYSFFFKFGRCSIILERADYRDLAG